MFRKPMGRKLTAGLLAATLTAAGSGMAVAHAASAPTAGHSSVWRFNGKAVVDGGTVAITSKFVAPTAGKYILDTEIYDDADNRKVGQWHVDKSMTAGQKVTLHYSWKVTNSGSFTLKQGAFTENWSRTIAWANDSADFSASPTSAAPVPTVTVAPKPTTVTPKPTIAPTSVAPKPTTVPVTPAPTVAPTVVPTPGSESGIFGNAKFYGPNKDAASQATSWQSSRPADAALMKQMASVPTAMWFGDWSGDIKAAVDRHVTAAAAQGAVAVAVAYNIPGRDCGQYSAGGAGSESAYNTWIDQFAAGIGSRKTIVVLEPDALAQMCGDTAARYRMLNRAVTSLAAQKGAITYIDAGTPAWISADEMTKRLQQAGVAKARGFALNVSNIYDTKTNVAYGDDIARRLGGKHYVVDTSRNGRGSNGQWCNPSGRALGQQPTAKTASTSADAYLWVKIPGQSDGTCSGGPSAGTWWPDYALGLARLAWAS